MSEQHPRVLLEAYQQYTRIAEDLRQQAAAVAEQRARAVYFLNQAGWGYLTIASQLGLTKGRVQQLVNAGKASIRVDNKYSVNLDRDSE